jgi:hypothetical protein
MVELYLHSPIRLHDIVLNCLIIGTTLPICLICPCRMKYMSRQNAVFFKWTKVFISDFESRQRSFWSRSLGLSVRLIFVHVFLGKETHSFLSILCGRLFCLHRPLGNTLVHIWNVFSLMATDCFSSLRAHCYCEGAFSPCELLGSQICDCEDQCHLSHVAMQSHKHLEDRGKQFIWNKDKYPPDYTASYIRNGTLDTVIESKVI